MGGLQSRVLQLDGRWEAEAASPLGQPIRFVVLRDKKRISLTIPAKPQPELLLACKQPLPKPAFVVVGGLVFVPLVSVYESLIPRRKLDSVLRQPAVEGEQVVLLLMVLRAEINIGYEELAGQLAALNGEKVHSLRWLLERVEQIETEQPKGNLTFRLESGEMIVLPVAKWRETEEEIFATHCIAHSFADLDILYWIGRRMDLVGRPTGVANLRGFLGVRLSRR